MQFLKANTQVKVVIGPFVDITDGLTPETGVTLSGADEAELIKHDAAAVTSISAATWAAITSADGYYNLTLTTSHTDTEGMLTVVVQDDSVCLPVRAQFMVLAEAAYDSMFTAKDTGFMDVNVKAVSEDTTAADNAEAFFDGTGYAGTNNVIPTVTTLTGHTAQTGDSFARLGAPAGASVSADIATVDGNVDAILTDTGTTIPAQISGLNDPTSAAIADAVWDEAKAGHVAAGSFGEEVQAHALSTEVSALNDLSAAEVNAEVDTALADYDAPTKAELDSGLAGLNDPTAAAIADAVWDEAIAGHAGAGSTGEALSNATAPTAAAVADAVWDETLSGHLGAGSTGEALNAAGSAGDPWVTALPGAYGAGSAGNIVGNLNDLSAAEVNAEVDTALADYDAPTKAELDSGFAALNDPTAAAVADAVWDEAKAGHVGAGSFGEEVQAHALSTEVSALNDLSAAEVNAEVDTAISDAALATAANLATVDTNVDAILVDTGTTLPATLTTIEGKIDTVDTNVDAILVDTGTTLPATLAGLNDLSAAEVNAEVVDVLTVDTIADSYATDGAQPTIAQAVLAIQQFLTEKAVAGTTVTVKKPDGSTTAMTFTLDDGTSPTSITRAS